MAGTSKNNKIKYFLKITSFKKLLLIGGVNKTNPK